MSNNSILDCMITNTIRDKLIAACNQLGINVPKYSVVNDLGATPTDSGDYVGGWQIGDYVIAGIDWGMNIEVANIYCPDGTVI